MVTDVVSVRETLPFGAEVHYHAFFGVEAEAT